VRGPQLAFGTVLRVARRFKQTFAAMVGKPGMLQCLEAEPESMLGRDHHNNTLLHLLLADCVHLLPISSRAGPAQPHAHPLPHMHRTKQWRC
jgi:hypothetical protein